MDLKLAIRTVLALIGLLALVSALVNLREHHSYAFASRLALFSAALLAFANPSPLEKLIREKPLVALGVGAFLLLLGLAYYLLFYVIFTPPR
jgi:hypothetical protein